MSDVPFSAVAGVDTRSIWTSLVSVSRPRPTVKTGTSAAFIASSASVSSPSVVSAPSVTTTRPASGSPASSCRAPSSAPASRVCAPLNVKSAGEAIRCAVEENRKLRRTNRLDSAFKVAASGPARFWRTNAPRAWPFTSAICMLRESSMRMPRKFCWGTAAFTTSTGRNRQNSTRASAASLSPTRTARWRVALVARADRYVRIVTMMAAATRAAATYEPVVGTRRNSPC